MRGKAKTSGVWVENRPIRRDQLINLLNNDSSKSQTLKTAAQPTRHFCSRFPPHWIYWFIQQTIFRSDGTLNMTIMLLFSSRTKIFWMAVPDFIYIQC